ncbi:mitochondrial sodium/calcium exchanger protein [Macrotis lagotis]|uniref:mitochondrial sodium/calcium exchanger protein n=1 Tax=Macrotis lagotis TaxID=92651 RepID=UPI003D6956B0
MGGSRALNHLQLLSWLWLLLRDTSPVQGAGPAAQTPGNPGPLALQEGMNSTMIDLECRNVRKLNASESCLFVKTNPDCQSDGGYLNYLEGIFCLFSPSLLPLVVMVYVLWLFYLFLFLAVTAEKFFCPNLSAISTTLKLSHNVAGVTFLAFGNGAPDVFSALVAFSNARTAGLAIGALFGAGVLVTTVVAGGIAIIRPFKAATRPFFRDVIFYMVAVFLMSTALYKGSISLFWSLGYLGLYGFYVFTVVFSTWIYQRQRVASHSLPNPSVPPVESEDGSSSVSNSYDYGDEFRPQLHSVSSTAQILRHSLNPLDYQIWKRKSWYWKLLKVFKMPVEFLLLLTVPLVDLDKDDRNWKRPLNCLHLITSPITCVMTLQSGAYGFYEIQGIFPIWAVTILAGTFLASITWFLTSNDQPPRFHWIFAFLGFFVSALWINAAATEVVNILHSLGIIFQLSNTVLGLTLLAWGNSIGDAISDLTLARQGYPRMAFSACFGGIIFNMLVGVGLGCVLEVSRDHMDVQLDPEGLLTWVLAGALGLSLLFTFLSVPIQCFNLTKIYGFCLLFFYLGFLLVALLTEFGVIHLRAK